MFKDLQEKQAMELKKDREPGPPDPTVKENGIHTAIR